ncbi:MAG: ATP-dependent DNA helicase RecG [Gammaproteobacteria bacterium]|nr:MAG: ATP-dependent DNA helicase RecG [Gammaproteobacteria bacterium]
MRHKKESKTSSFRLRGVGKQIAKHLARLEIHSLEDLLFHLPARYQDRTQIQPIRTLIPGNEVVVEGVIHTVSTPSHGRTKLLCELKDDTGTLYLRFFHVFSFQADTLKPGTRLRCYSEVRLGQKGLEMVHPEFQIITPHRPIPIEHHLTPIYPATEGLSQYMLRKLTSNALAAMQNDPSLREIIPTALLQPLSFPALKDALQFVHRPPRDIPIPQLMENQTLPQKRLIFEELLAHRISLLHIKQRFQSQAGVPLLAQEKLSSQLLTQLPFQLTQAQVRVITEIRTDLLRPHPMLRLVQGDVGSGKTIIAVLAMLQAVGNNCQAAMMAPTELLAEQHYRVMKKWLEPLGLTVAFLSSQIKGRERTATLKAIRNGEAQIILGTHALFQEDVQFANLALVVVDEQHRFGVHQRALFRAKGMQADYYPHQLIMTATPIPRTLAMSFYADLDVSIIDELPPGRTPVMTSVIASSRREEVIARIQSACNEGRQVYWVCPLIEESEVLNCQAATQTTEQLQTLLPGIKIGLIHGRMRAEDKEAVMRAFQQGELHLLVATTVIEVGVDVPNASVMVIENAERLGLSQLHQLRGRVGRGEVASYCLLLYQHPLSELAKERLAVMRETTDGFQIAQRDLALRGPGEVLGTKQTGELSFRVADLIRDSEMLPQVHQAAEVILRDHVEVIEPLMERWLGEGKEYGKV